MHILYLGFGNLDTKGPVGTDFKSADSLDQVTLMFGKQKFGNLSLQSLWASSD